jgi:predicted Zn-dependent protease
MPEIKKALVTAPDVSLLHFFMGGCFLETKDYPNAAVELRKAVKLDPGFTHAEMNLGRALMYSRQDEEATIAFEHVAKTEPNIMDAHIFLIVLYVKQDRPEDAAKECRFVLQQIPDNFGANLNLGRALAMMGDMNGALPPLQKAVVLEPQKPFPHVVLADVYSHLGREDDAKQERAEAERLGGALSGSESTPNNNEGKPE